jgi:Zn-dependent oligopeptidase
MKISTSRLKRIIQEELFYREFRREGLELEEAKKAKDERISRKIAYLVDKEGMPRDQAVAIAHSMEERGELE